MMGIFSFSFLILLFFFQHLSNSTRWKQWATRSWRRSSAAMEQWQSRPKSRWSHQVPVFRFDKRRTDTSIQWPFTKLIVQPLAASVAYDISTSPTACFINRKHVVGSHELTLHFEVPFHRCVHSTATGEKVPEMFRAWRICEKVRVLF